MSKISDLARETVAHLKDDMQTPKRSKTSGIVSKTTDSAILLDANGDIQQMSNKNTQMQTNSESSSSTDIAYEKNIVTNRYNIKTDDITLNSQKLNPYIYNMANFIQTSDQCIQGHLNMASTVLVRAWEPTLEKYVFIRRVINMPILFPVMTSPVIDSRFDIFDEPTDDDESTSGISSGAISVNNAGFVDTQLHVKD